METRQDTGTEPMTKYVRTQLECLEADSLAYGFFVAGRSVEEIVRVPQTEIPYDIRRRLTVGTILHAKVEIGVPRGMTPKFDSWEWG